MGKRKNKTRAEMSVITIQNSSAETINIISFTVWTTKIRDQMCQLSKFHFLRLSFQTLQITQICGVLSTEKGTLFFAPPGGSFFTGARPPRSQNDTFYNSGVAQLQFGFGA